MEKDIEMKNETKKEEKDTSNQKEDLTAYIERMKSEISSLPLDQIKSKIKALESQNQTYKGDINKMKVDIRKFTARIKENKKKLTMSCGLPHLISNVAEIFDLEEIDKDEGSGLNQEKLKYNNK